MVQFDDYTFLSMSALFYVNKRISQFQIRLYILLLLAVCFICMIFQYFVL